MKKSASKMSRTTKKMLSNPFLNYLRDFRREMQGQNISVRRLCQLAGQRWREMTPEQRQPYIQLAEKARRLERRKRGSKTHSAARRSRRSDSPTDKAGPPSRKKRGSDTSASQSFSSETSASSNG